MGSSSIAAVVVIYHPSSELVDNIVSYSWCVDKVYVYLNSSLNPMLLEALRVSFGSKCEFLGDEQNKGIAFGLNSGAKCALEAGYSWLLTMDQDSRFREGANLSGELQSGADLIFPRYEMRGELLPPDRPPWIMTSGNVIRLDTWQRLGGFDNKYFIDAVDTSYCVRLMLNDGCFKLVNELVLIHELGESLEYKQLFGLKFRITNHSALRLYYCVRNYLDLAGRCLFRAPKWSLFLTWVVCLRIAKAVLFERQKGQKLLYTIRGVRDLVCRRFGEYSEK
ncbi:hypothetical protein QFX18_16885 [Saccharophagus degradans]|uniref:hypothetical protein n=1 Tax=Saccharophagus degradans TaxID=86304 RepID=UPI00247824D9|nr:hypothetical protein [Saccharophagus degradans]WGO97688.1 hypothetical protein QFX18_16885 [Saccharophagus degradans]